MSISSLKYCTELKRWFGWSFVDMELKRKRERIWKVVKRLVEFMS